MLFCFPLMVILYSNIRIMSIGFYSNFRIFFY
nr:MAG TPA: hypothetical protein [Caudoviricetes sp.]